MRNRMRAISVSAAVLALAACQQAPAPTTNTAGPVTTEVGPGSVGRVDPAPTPSPTPLVQDVIKTQAGPDGSQVALNKVAVTGDVLTVQLTYSGGENRTQFVDPNQISVIDDATAKQIGVLKDGAGKWLAAPLSSQGDKLVFTVGRSTQIVWFKFPAPPATSPTVSINIPDVVPFDGVPVTR